MPTLTERVTTIENSHNRLADDVRKNNAQTQEMYDVFTSAKGGLNAIAWMAKAIKVAFFPVMLIIAIVVYLKTGKWEVPL